MIVKMKKHECEFCGKAITCKNKENISILVEDHEIGCMENQRIKRAEIEAESKRQYEAIKA